MIAQYSIVFNHSNELIVKSFWDTGLKYWNTNTVCTFEYCILDVLYCTVVYFTLSMCSIRTRTFTTVRRHLKAQAQASMFRWLAPVPSSICLCLCLCLSQLKTRTMEAILLAVYVHRRLLPAIINVESELKPTGFANLFVCKYYKLYM